jgi:membrane carboxypeptidase/penicillin-binding protein
MRVETGALLALVGGADHTQSQFNRAVQARRQPGSCFKPFVFAAGIEAGARDEEGGLTAATLLEDAPLELWAGGQRWSPQNFDRIYRGPVTVRRALEESLNVPTVRAAEAIGLERVIRTAHACGIVSPLPAVPSLALGAVEVTPLELATAFATLARRGERIDPWVVREVTDREGQTRTSASPQSEPVISPQAAFIVHDMLEGVFERGTAASAASLGFVGPAAGKTGTTDDTRDAWFVGDASGVLALVWVGYDDNARTGLTGASGALPLWVDLMQRGPLEAPESWSVPPLGVIVRSIDPTTGDRALAGCPEWQDEWFVRGTEPTRPCAEHRDGFLRRWLRRLGPGLR